MNKKTICELMLTMLDQTDDSCHPKNIQRHEIPNRYSTVKILKAKEQVADKYKDRTRLTVPMR